jgi:hypothetical protein
MEVSARIVGKGRPPRGERLFLRDLDVTGEDYSGRKLHELSIASSRFRRCRFERMRVAVAGLGVLGHPAEFVECSFDGSRLGPPCGGSARFERCSFRNVNIPSWICESVELVDCVFSGKVEAVFFGTIPDNDLKLRERLGRVRNEFHGNDFTGVHPFGISFIEGIDLSVQRLPLGKDLAILDDPATALSRVIREIETWPRDDRRDIAETLLRRYEEDAANGQKQLLLHTRFGGARRGQRCPTRPAPPGYAAGAGRLSDHWAPIHVHDCLCRLLTMVIL